MSYPPRLSVVFRLLRSVLLVSALLGLLGACGGGSGSPSNNNSASNQAPDISTPIPTSSPSSESVLLRLSAIEKLPLNDLSDPLGGGMLLGRTEFHFDADNTLSGKTDYAYTHEGNPLMTKNSTYEFSNMEMTAFTVTENVDIFDVPENELESPHSVRVSKC